MRLLAAAAADPRAEYDRLAALYLPVALVVLAAVWLALIWVVVRGRRRRSPSRRHDHTRLEAGYALGLVVIVAVLVAATYRTEAKVDDPRARPAERIDVTAAKWHWRFSYPAHGIVIQGSDEREPTLVVPAGRPVAFSARSLDVVHGFWIPQTRFQRELFPTRVTRFELTFEPGMDGSSAPCSFFCGLRHQRMRFALRVLPPAEFAAWARRRGAAGGSG